MTNEQFIPISNKDTEKKRKEEILPSLYEKYIKGTPFENLKLEEVAGKIFNDRDGNTALEQIGISKDKNGRYRLKNPNPEAKALGQYENPEALKSFLVGFSEVKTTQDLYPVLEDVFRYIGIPFTRPSEGADPIKELIKETQTNNPSAQPEEIQKIVGEKISGNKNIPEQARNWFKTVILLAGAIFAIDSNKGRLQESPVQASEIGTRVEMVASSEEGEKTHSFEYTIQKGDTIWDIVEKSLKSSSKSGAVSNSEIANVVQRVLQANNLTEETAKQIQPGQKIQLPDLKI